MLQNVGRLLTLIRETSLPILEQLHDVIGLMAVVVLPVPLHEKIDVSR